MSKAADLREQNPADEQLELLLREVQNNLFRLRLQSETERLEAPSEIVKAKREVARIKTILRLRELGLETALRVRIPPIEKSDRNATIRSEGTRRQRPAREPDEHSKPSP